MLFDSIFDFFYNLIFNTAYLEDIGGGSVGYFTIYNGEDVILESTNIDAYLSLICTYISVLIILVLCCLFVAKIIKLIGNLIK